METLYPVVAEWDEQVGAWSLLSPDFPEIASVATSGEDVGQQASDALWTAMEARQEDEEPVPEPMAEPWRLTESWPNPTRNMLLFVPVPAEPVAAQPVRVNVSLDKRLLDRIDSEASRLGMTWSAFLAESAKARLRG